jgi:hypothetical protein
VELAFRGAQELKGLLGWLALGKALTLFHATFDLHTMTGTFKPATDSRLRSTLLLHCNFCINESNFVILHKTHRDAQVPLPGCGGRLLTPSEALGLSPGGVVVAGPH